MDPKKFGVLGEFVGAILPNMLGIGLVTGLAGNPLKRLPAEDAATGGVGGLEKKPGEGEGGLAGMLNTFPGDIVGFGIVLDGAELGRAVWKSLSVGGAELIDRRGGVLVRLGAPSSLAFD